MAKKKGLARIAKKRRARKSSRPRRSATQNPPVLKDLGYQILPAFGAYAGTRLFSRIIYSLIQRKWPKLGKHAGALAAVSAFGGAWMLAHRVKQLKPYHDVIVVGSGVAALQTVVRTYLPKYGWVVADYKPADIGQLPATSQQAEATAMAAAEFEDEFSYLEDELDEADKHVPPAAAVPPQSVTPSDADASDWSGLLDDDEDMSDLYQGSFAN